VFFQSIVDADLVKDAETITREIDGAADGGVRLADFVDHAMRRVLRSRAMVGPAMPQPMMMTCL
jgi:predicted thioredoxin/glutaredoxin